MNDKQFPEEVMRYLEVVASVLQIGSDEAVIYCIERCLKADIEMTWRCEKCGREKPFITHVGGCLNCNHDRFTKTYYLPKTKKVVKEEANMRMRHLTKT